MIGLCWALRPVAVWKRLASLGLAFVGVAVIYFTHVRSALVMLAFCLVVLTGLFVLQKNYRQAVLLATAVLDDIVLVRSPGRWPWKGGSTVIQRFASLVNTNPAQLYYSSRGVFVEEALSDVLALPAGLRHGPWWGMIYRVGFNARLLHSPDLRGWNRYTVNLLGARLRSRSNRSSTPIDRCIRATWAGCLRDASRFASAGDA